MRPLGLSGDIQRGIFGDCCAEHWMCGRFEKTTKKMVEAGWWYLNNQAAAGHIRPGGPSGKQRKAMRREMQAVGNPLIFLWIAGLVIQIVVQWWLSRQEPPNAKLS